MLHLDLDIFVLRQLPEVIEDLQDVVIDEKSAGSVDQQFRTFG